MAFALDAPTELRREDGWVSASRTRNHCLDDPLLDWLNSYGEKRGFVPDHKRDGYDPRTDFLDFIIRQGQRFEFAVLAHLATRQPVRTIADEWRDTYALAKVHETFEAMAEGAPVITQAVLWNPANCTFGAADLLLRSDVLRDWFPESLSEDELAIGAPYLDAPWHYRVVDVKFSTLHLDSTGHAGSRHLEYMAQVFLYNEALGAMQGYTPPCGYLLGRGWEQGASRSRSCMERLARVDRHYETPRAKIPLARTVAEALAWVRCLRAHGATWDVRPEPSVPELRPNVGNIKDQPWHHAKRQIGHAQQELTLLWQVGVEKRRRANAAGILRWTDPRVTAASLGVTGATFAPVLDRLLAVNRSADGPPLQPARAVAAESVWRQPGAVEFYVDFETVTNLKDDFSRIPEQGGQDLIFMIGCGHLEDGEWRFACFTARDLSEPAEAAIIDDWLRHMERVRARLAPELERPVVFHWSHAEVTVLETAYRSAVARHPEKAWPTPNWFDFHKEVVKKEPVVVRGAMGFGLKAIARAMHRHGLIGTVWEDGPTDGLGAMVGAWWCEDEARRLGCELPELPLMQEIARYNEVDCRVLMEIVGCLRGQH